MGLDITGYSKVKLVEGSDDPTIECLCEWVEERGLNVAIPYLNEDFPLHSEGLKNGVYGYRNSYEGGRRSYSGWSNFREELAKLAGYAPMTEEEVPDEWDYYTKQNFLLRPHQSRVFNVTEGILFEIINFTACEGVINTKMCNKI